VRLGLRAIAALALCVLLASAAGCVSRGFSKRTTLILATTTSAEDSGILDEFTRRFEKDYPYTLKAVAVGSGAALFMGRNGDADVMLTHEPNAEKEFMDAGYGETIDKVMHNDFIIVGPKSDPAGIRGLTDAAAAAKRIAEKGSAFVSRGDASGTNAMELDTWERAGVKPSASRYMETGQGMGETLRIADQKNAYTLTDRATFIVLEDSLSLSILVQGDPLLVNQYSVTVVDPKRSSRINNHGAIAFRDFLLAPATQKVIADFGWNQYHEHLFYSY
jgi:tungstate transport system substrate-binding protein